MGGICGIVNWDSRPVDPESLLRMTRAAIHRGRDGICHAIDGNAGLAYLSLEVVPESGGEPQPITSIDDGLTLVADARLDNRGELIDELSASGHLTSGDASDAELILAAFRRWGTDSASRLIGDFAFAIWDSRRRRLFAARDPFAMRAFYYRIEPERALFATELKQILAAPKVEARIFEPAIGALLAGDTGPLDWTFYEDIAQLEPAAALLVNEQGYRVWKYWEPDPAAEILYPDERDYEEHFLDIFKKAVGSRLRSAKPVGIFLSGGMDSGSVASMAGWLRERNGANGKAPVHAYCYAFDELEQCDERHISDHVVRRYNVPATSVPVESAWPLKDYPDHGPDRDDAFVGPYQPMEDLALAMARDEGIGVMLSGGRGDCMTGGGIFDYLDLLFAGRLQTLWADLHEHSKYDGLSMYGMVGYRVLGPLRAAVWPAGRIDWLRRPVRRLLRRPRPYPAWIRPEFATRVKLNQILDRNLWRHRVKGFARRRRFESVFSPLDMQASTGSERNCAQFGLAAADPWSDRRLAEFVLAVPQRLLNRAGEQKRLTRRAMTGIMPEEARRHARKIYPIDLYQKATRKTERRTVLELMKNSQLAARGYVDAQILRGHFESVDRAEMEDDCFWPALSAEMWLRRYWV